MKTRQNSSFVAIRTEGAILPADVIRRVVENDKDLPGLSPSDYHLAGNEKINEAVNRSWSRLLGAWAAFKQSISEIPKTDPATALTRERWLMPLFQELGYGRLLPNRAALNVEGKDYAISHLWQHTPIHLIGANLDLDKRAPGVSGAAKATPHSLVQEFLNRSGDHLWAILSNGKCLRLLRDNKSLTRQAFVEFDLEGIFDGLRYPEFTALWLVAHQSRVEAEQPDQCLLEQWSKTSAKQGARVLDKLRDGITEAIQALGAGFLHHRGNDRLRRKLETGALTPADYYRQLLRIVYRLLFLLVAEDRELLHTPKCTTEETAEVLQACERYRKYYSTERLRRLALAMRGTAHVDLWPSLKVVFSALEEKGSVHLALPALDSFLWSSEAVPDLIPATNAPDVANRDLLVAIRAMAFTEEGKTRRPVDFRNLGSEELGSVYESLLELVPDLNIDNAEFTLRAAGGNERKTTGSYYTPASLISCLLDSALDPVLDEAAKKGESAILDLKICDPACGSGHFLIAAANRIAKRLASVRTGEEEPSPEAIRHARRDVIGRCIHGVDINPMAVELCKVALWMESLEPGKPLSFLDHRIQCGNALIGATPELLKAGIPDEAFAVLEGDDKAVTSEAKKRNKKERVFKQDSLFDMAGEPWQYLGNLATAMVQLEDISDDSVEGVRTRASKYAEFIHSQGYRYNRLLADAWCAAFVWKKTKDGLPPITEQLFRAIEHSPFRIDSFTQMEIQRLAAQYQFFHWHLAFPEVFDPEGRGGFDCVLGNPPWEKLQTEELQFFAFRNPRIADLKGAKRKVAIKELKETDPLMEREWKEQKRVDKANILFIRKSNKYPLTGIGKFNTFAIFSELNYFLISPKGRVGCIVPSGIAIDDTTKFFFQKITVSKSLVSLFDFENREGLFADVDSRMRFCLLTLCGTEKQNEGGGEFVFYACKIEDILQEERRLILTSKDFKWINPNTLTCASFRTKRDLEINKKVYEKNPIFLNEENSENNFYNPLVWRLLNTTDDSGYFLKPLNDNFYELIPVIEAKTIHQFDHRFATFEELGDGKVEPVEVSSVIKNSIFLESNARYYISENLFKERMPDSFKNKKWFLTVRNITNATNERTVISAIIPKGASCEVTPYIEISGGTDNVVFLIGVFNSFIFDYLSRQKVGGTHLSYFILYQLPVLLPKYSVATPKDFFYQRVIELTYTSYSVGAFSSDCGYAGEPFRWDDDRRFLMRCELDAAFFHLYGINRDDADYILDTFPIVRRKDEQHWGEFRTKRVILEIYDEMARAMAGGPPYRTRLDPPPANGWVPPPVPPTE